MRQLTRTLLVGVLIVAAAAISAGPVGAGKGGTDRPFKASGTGTIINEPTGDCDLVFPGGVPTLLCDQSIALDLKATHLGKSTNTSVGTLTLYVGLAGQCDMPNGNLGTPFQSNQAVTIIAANGDELTADTTVTGCGNGVDVAEPAGTYTITGGTGRFERATGTGTVEAVTLGTSLTNNWVGTISY